MNKSEAKVGFGRGRRLGLLVPGKHVGIETIETSEATEGDGLKALTWHGKRDVRADNVPDPAIQEPTDAVVRVTTTAICGSDLHLYEVLTPFMEEGDILGHEPMGIVEEVSVPRSPTSPLEIAS